MYPDRDMRDLVVAQRELFQLVDSQDAFGKGGELVVVEMQDFQVLKLMDFSWDIYEKSIKYYFYYFCLV